MHDSIITRYVERTVPVIIPDEKAIAKAKIDCDEQGRALLSQLQIEKTKNAKLEIALDSAGNLSVNATFNPDTVLVTVRDSIFIEKKSETKVIVNEVEKELTVMQKIYISVGKITFWLIISLIIIIIAYLMFKSKLKTIFPFLIIATFFCNSTKLQNSNGIIQTPSPRESIQPIITKQTANEIYINEHINLAILHQFKYGIPAEITIAQAILETGYGKSKLAKHYNNHFGITHNRNYNCVKLNGVNYASYSTIRECYDNRAEIFTENKRYRILFYLKRDYREWAYTLQRIGYAEDKNYAEKLVNIIERRNLQQKINSFQPSTNQYNTVASTHFTNF